MINGSPSNFFRASRGLRQGCPLSPFLFLLIVDALSRIIFYVKRTGSFKGIKITISVDLTHILFVDDVVMMGEGTQENLKEEEKIMELYKKAMGCTSMLKNLFFYKMPSQRKSRRGSGWKPLTF